MKLSMADNYSQSHPQFLMEITVLSAKNLKKPASCCLLSRRLRTLVSITKFAGDNNSGPDCKADFGNFTFGDKFLVSIESNFFVNNSCLYLELHTKRLFGGQARLGWCHIPAADIGAPPVGSVRHLSYKLRDKGGTMGHGSVVLRVKLESYGCQGQEVIGMPVTIFQPTDDPNRRINWPEEGGAPH